MDYRSEAPEILKGFLTYHEIIKGHSKRTVDEYYLDLRTFFRFLKLEKGLVPRTTELSEISISDIDASFVKSISLTDVYSYLSFLSRDRVRQYREATPEYGLNAKSRARKIATIRSYYKYLTVKAHILDENPVQDLDSPKVMKSLPHYLTLDESRRLLSSVDGGNKERDFCIITIFLNCGLRISEVVGLGLSDIGADTLRVLGKGNKERIVYLNEACAKAINDYLLVRKNIAALDKNALFLSNRRKRISRETVHHLVKNYITAAGLDSKTLSSHKLRHTAATLMLQNGVDIRTLQELLGHEHLNTTEIYTHVSSTELKTAANANPLGSFKADKNN
jgi:site-specific recombinase XerD